MKICPKCDAQNANNAPVCKHCGANLNETPEIEEAKLADDDTPTYHLNLSLLFLFLSFAFSSVKALIPCNVDYPEWSEPYIYLYYGAYALGVIFLITAIICARGLLKAKPFPGKGIFVIMGVVVCTGLILMDTISVIQTVTGSGKYVDFAEYSEYM